MGTEDAAFEQDPQRPPYRLVFRNMPEGFGLEVVQHALQHRTRASASVRDRLNRRLRRLKVPGFRNASRATPAQLAIPVLDAIFDGDSRLAGAVLRCWEEANASLRGIAAAQLAEAGVECPAKRDTERFGSTWPDKDWNRHRRAVLEAHGDLSRHAVGLMLMVLVDRYPIVDDVDLPDVVSPRFVRWLDELDALPPTAVEWEDAYEFARAVDLVAETKSAELLMAVFLRREEIVKEMVATYPDELAYLGVDPSLWARDDGRDPLLVMRVADELAKALAEYQPVRQQAGSRADELKRAVQRAQCEEKIVEIVARWEALETDAFVVPEATTPDDADRAGEDVDHAAEIDRLTRELAAARTELDELRTAHAKLREEHGRAGEDNEVLRLSRTQLAADIDALQSEVARHREAEEHWRQAYVEACKTRSVETGAAPEIANVRDAVTLAEQAFPDSLHFALNGKSDLGIPFAKPAEVFDALAWLATCYRRQGATIGETCPGWFYKPDQTEGTTGKYRQWYETSVRGRTVEILNHVGKGASFDPKSTIRIGFAWDDEHARVVVGFIGRHQRTK